MKETKILVVEDEEKIAQIIVAYLEKEGFKVTTTSSGVSALKLAQSEDPDLIVLDLMLPDLSGEEVCQRLRQSSSVPVIMVTARTSEEERVGGLNMGADDYLTKPFSPRELVARVHSILRRTHFPEYLGEILTFDEGALTINSGKHEVKVGGALVSLTPSEFKLLETLVSYPGRVYTRFELINKVQGYDFEGYERTIDAHIKNLRQKIEKDPKKPRYIKTVFGVGYKFED